MEIPPKSCDQHVPPGLGERSLGRVQGTLHQGVTFELCLREWAFARHRMAGLPRGGGCMSAHLRQDTAQLFQGKPEEFSVAGAKGWEAGGRLGLGHEEPPSPSWALGFYFEGNGELYLHRLGR